MKLEIHPTLFLILATMLYGCQAGLYLYNKNWWGVLVMAGYISANIGLIGGL